MINTAVVIHSTEVPLFRFICWYSSYIHCSKDSKRYLPLENQNMERRSNIYKTKWFKVPLPQHVLFTSLASASGASCQSGMQHNKAKIFSNVISTECTDKQPHQCIVTPQPVHLLMPHWGSGPSLLQAWQRALLLFCSKQTIFRSELIQEDIASLLSVLLFFSAHSRAALLAGFAFVMWLGAAVWVLKSIPWLPLLTRCCFSSSGSFGVC